MRLKINSTSVILLRWIIKSKGKIFYKIYLKLDRVRNLKKIKNNI